MFRLLAAVMVIAGTTCSANAFTGAELIQVDQNFARGYLLGVVDMRIGVKAPDDVQFDSVRKCVVDSKATAATLLKVVSNYLDRNPQELSTPAFGGIINALADMCVPKR
jgi:hypothetical protein